jgi:enoyl-CoA hydratase/carnithine racemase
MSAELMRNIRDSVNAAPGQGYRAMAISGRSGMFSAGLDIAEMLTLDRTDATAFFDALFSLLKALAASRIPIAAAITGQSPAGGAVLSTFCDYRVMAAGDYRFGYNEVAVGLVVPRPVHAAIARIAGAEVAERMCAEGRLVGPGEAQALGLVHEVVPPAEVIPRALAWCQKMAALPQAAMSTMRDYARRSLVKCFEGFEDENDYMARVFFSDEAQRVLRDVMQRLKAKGK